jgi:hypothetical protein
MPGSSTTRHLEKMHPLANNAERGSGNDRQLP